MLDVSSDDGLVVIYAENNCDDRDAPSAPRTTLTGAECFSLFDYFPDSLWERPGGDPWIYMDSFRGKFSQRYDPRLPPGHLWPTLRFEGGVAA